MQVLPLVVWTALAGAPPAAEPAPLKANSLRQSIEWDGTDDIGRSVPKGAYRVRAVAIAALARRRLVHQCVVRCRA